MNKKIIITIIVVLIIIGFIFVVATSLSRENIEQQEVNKNELEIKTNKETIYELFNNFPESNNMYYTSKKLYNEGSIGPTIYQIDILAELTDEACDNFISQVEFEELNNFEIKVKPHNINYDWKSIKNTQVIESKNIEDASIRSIYLDENTKTIYVIVIGGN